jgi:hypothetical protein
MGLKLNKLNDDCIVCLDISILQLRDIRDDCNKSKCGYITLYFRDGQISYKLSETHDKDEICDYVATYQTYDFINALAQFKLKPDVDLIINKTRKTLTFDMIVPGIGCFRSEIREVKVNSKDVRLDPVMSHCNSLPCVS